MDLELIDITSASILIAAVLGGIRFRKLDPGFFPFILLIWLGVISEGASLIIITQGHTNEVQYNIFLIVEAVLILLQFYKWKLFSTKAVFYSFLSGLILCWVAEDFIFFSIHTFNSYFIIIASYTLVLLSINMINRLLNSETGSLIKNPVFLISLGFILYFTYAVLVEIFLIYGMENNISFSMKIFNILIYINLITNLIYSVAIIWIPTKSTFILPSSSRAL
jgi:hypothetical protein